jgi:hypothetical protein
MSGQRTVSRPWHFTQKANSHGKAGHSEFGATRRALRFTDPRPRKAAQQESDMLKTALSIIVVWMFLSIVVAAAFSQILRATKPKD